MFKPTCGRRPGHLARARALAAAACALVTAPWLFSLFISWLFSNRPSWPPPPWPPSTDVRTPAPDTSQDKRVVKKKKRSGSTGWKTSSKSIQVIYTYCEKTFWFHWSFSNSKYLQTLRVFIEALTSGHMTRASDWLINLHLLLSLGCKQTMAWGTDTVRLAF